MDADAVGKRLQYLEAAVHSVGALAVSAAKGCGKDRSSREMVAFFVGQAKERALELWRNWEEGARASKQDNRTSSPVQRPLPFKVQVMQLLGDLLQEKGRVSSFAGAYKILG